MNLLFLLISLNPMCIWDRDTLRAEAKGLPGIIETAAGLFEQYPNMYYEMRLKRVQALAAQDQLKAGDYDDGAVALDRLGKSSEAIEMMIAKKGFLAAQGIEGAAPHYRYHANLGTSWFIVGCAPANHGINERTFVLRSVKYSRPWRLIPMPISAGRSINWRSSTTC